MLTHIKDPIPDAIQAHVHHETTVRESIAEQCQQAFQVALAHPDQLGKVQDELLTLLRVTESLSIKSSDALGILNGAKGLSLASPTPSASSNQSVEEACLILATLCRINMIGGSIVSEYDTLDEDGDLNASMTAQSFLDKATKLAQSANLTHPSAMVSIYSLRVLQAEIYLAQKNWKFLQTWLRVNEEKAKLANVYGWWYSVAIKYALFLAAEPTPLCTDLSSATEVCGVESALKQIQSLHLLAVNCQHREMVAYLSVIMFNLMLNQSLSDNELDGFLRDGRQGLAELCESSETSSNASRLSRLMLFIDLMEVILLHKNGKTKEAQKKLSHVHHLIDSGKIDANQGIIVINSASGDHLKDQLLDEHSLSCFVYYISGVVYFSFDMSRARTFFEGALTFWSDPALIGANGGMSLHGPWGISLRVRVLLMLSSINLSLGANDSCLDQLYTAVHLAHDLSDSLWAQSKKLVFLYFAAYYQVMGDSDRAIQYYKNILSQQDGGHLSKGLDEVAAVASCNLALLYFSLGQVKDAGLMMEYLSDLVARTEKIKSSMTLKTKKRKGLTEGGGGSPSFPIHLRGIHAILSSLSTLAQGEIQATKVNILKCLELTQSCKSNPLKYASLLILSQLFADHPSECSKHLQTAFNIAKQSQLKRGCVETAGLLRDHYATSKDSVNESLWAETLSALSPPVASPIPP